VKDGKWYYQVVFQAKHLHLRQHLLLVVGENLQA
jgi:hypothetical protein